MQNKAKFILLNWATCSTLNTEPTSKKQNEPKNRSAAQILHLVRRSFNEVGSFSEGGRTQSGRPVPKGEASPLRYHSPRPAGTSSFWLLAPDYWLPKKQNEPNFLRFQPKKKDYQKNEPNSNPNLFI
jgi:hypothetical protein